MGVRSSDNWYNNEWRAVTTGITMSGERKTQNLGNNVYGFSTLTSTIVLKAFITL